MLRWSLQRTVKSNLTQVHFMNDTFITALLRVLSSLVKLSIIALPKQNTSTHHHPNRYTISRGAMGRWLGHDEGLIHCERYTVVFIRRRSWKTPQSGRGCGNMNIDIDGHKFNCIQQWDPLPLICTDHQIHRIFNQFGTFVQTILTRAKAKAIHSVLNGGKGCIITSVTALSPLMWVRDQINLTSTSCA